MKPQYHSAQGWAQPFSTCFTCLKSTFPSQTVGLRNQGKTVGLLWDKKKNAGYKEVRKSMLVLSQSLCWNRGWSSGDTGPKEQENLTRCFISQKILAFFLLLLQKEPFEIPEINPTVLWCSSSLNKAQLPQQLPRCSIWHSSQGFEELSSFLLLLLITLAFNSASFSPTPRHDEPPQTLVFYHFGGLPAITCSNLPFYVLSIPTALLTPLRGEETLTGWFFFRPAACW